MRICLMAGKQAGVVGLLTAYCKHDILAVIAYSQEVRDIAKILKIETYDSIYDPYFKYLILKTDLLLSVHGREIVPKELLIKPSVNVHPYLYTYKGIRPIKQALKDKNYKASVGMHYMTEDIDNGEVIVENMKQVTGTTEKEIYNELYPLYALTILQGLEKICNSDK